MKLSALLALLVSVSSASIPEKRESSTPLGVSKPDTPMDAEGISCSHTYKGFPNRGVGPEQSKFIGATLYNFLFPGSVPPGVNPSTCELNDKLPIVLVPGTFESVYTNWASLGPKLAAKGYCVYSFEFNPLKIISDGLTVPGTAFLGDIRQSSVALSEFIDNVLSLTGAEQVDIIGHSQGAGCLPFWYYKFDMKGSKVRKSIGLSATMGVDFFHVEEITKIFFPGVLGDIVHNLMGSLGNAYALSQQLLNSEFIKQLKEGGIGVPSVEYINIATKYDDFNTPYTDTMFNQTGINTTNIVVQDLCEADKANHVSLPYDSNVHQIIFNALEGRPTAEIDCVSRIPIIDM